MATITPTFTVIDGRRFSVTWAAMSPGDDGAPVEVSGAEWRSAQAIGSGSVILSFSEDGTNWGSGISLSAANPIDVVNRARYLKPASVFTAAMDVILHCAN